jgi:transposase-like protein
MGKAAKWFFRRLLKRLQCVPKLIATDMRRDGVARVELLPSAEHRQSHDLNNRSENSHGPVRRREGQMQRFSTPRQAQCVVSAYRVIDGQCASYGIQALKAGTCTGVAALSHRASFFLVNGDCPRFT